MGELGEQARDDYYPSHGKQTKDPIPKDESQRFHSRMVIPKLQRMYNW